MLVDRYFGVLKGRVSSKVDFLESRRQGGGGFVCGRTRAGEAWVVGKLPRPREMWVFFQQRLKDVKEAWIYLCQCNLCIRFIHVSVKHHKIIYHVLVSSYKNHFCCFFVLVLS